MAFGTCGGFAVTENMGLGRHLAHCRCVRAVYIDSTTGGCRKETVMMMMTLTMTMENSDGSSVNGEAGGCGNGEFGSLRACRWCATRRGVV